MGEFMGNAEAVAVQRALAARHDAIAADPRLANGGRILNILDPDAYGWDGVRDSAFADGYVALTMVEKAKTFARIGEVFGDTVETPFWEAFVGTPDQVLPICRELVAKIEIPEGWRLETTTSPDQDTIRAVQTLNAETGVSPAPAYFMRGDTVPGLLACLYDEDGNLAASAATTMRYHADGRLGGWVFAGGVSVSPAHQRRQLGALINAVALLESHAAFGWKCALEQAKADNAASVGMIRKCGLSQDPDFVTIVVNTTGSYVTR